MAGPDSQIDPAVVADSTVVLYVEDDDLTRERIAARLVRKGVDVVAVASGEEALEICKDLPDVAVMLLDLDLPGISGLETWNQVRAKFPRIVGVVCSGALDDRARRQLEQLGLRSDCCLCKPCRFDELLDALQRARRNSAHSSQTQS